MSSLECDQFNEEYNSKILGPGLDMYYRWIIATISLFSPYALIKVMHLGDKTVAVIKNRYDWPLCTTVITRSCLELIFASGSVFEWSVERHGLIAHYQSESEPVSFICNSFQHWTEQVAAVLQKLVTLDTTHFYRLEMVNNVWCCTSRTRVPLRGWVHYSDSNGTTLESLAEPVPVAHMKAVRNVSSLYKLCFYQWKAPSHYEMILCEFSNRSEENFTSSLGSFVNGQYYEDTWSCPTWSN